MRTKTRWILILAAVAAGIAFTVISSKITEGPGFFGRSSVAEEQHGRSATRRARAEVAATRPIEGKAFVEQPEEAAESRAPDRDHDLHGKVVDPDDKPVPGAAIAVIRNEARELDVLDLEYHYAEHVVADVKTDSQGRFQVRVPQGRPFDLAVTSAGYPKAKATNRYAGEFVTIKLSVPAALKGVVTRQKDGSPVANAKLRAWRDGPDHAQLFRGATDPNGAYEIPGLEPGKIVLEVAPPVLAAPPWQNLKLVAGETLVCNLALQEGGTVTGVVVDAATKAPIADAEVGEGWTFFRPVRTGADGRYVLTGVSREHGEVHVRAKGYGRTCKEFPDPIPEKLTFDFALDCGRSVRGRVVSSDRSPLAGVYVAAAGSGYVGGVQQIDWPATRTGSDGQFEIRDLTRAVRHAVCLRKEGFGSALFDLPPSETASERIEVGDLVLEKAGGLSGMVVDANDRPLPGVRLLLIGRNADRFRLWSENEPKHSTLDNYFEEAAGRSDDLGRFRFTDLATGEYRLRRSGGSVNAPGIPVAIRAGETLEGVRLVIPVEFSIKGRIELPDGRPATMCVVDARREDGDAKSGGRESSCLSTGGGEFELQRLDAGTYTVSAFATESTDPGSKTARAEVRGVRAGSENVRIVLPKSHPITGTVLDSEGKGLKDQLVTASDIGSGEQITSSTTGPDGAFSIDVADGQIVRLEALTPVYHGERVSMWTEPKVDGGEQRAGAKGIVIVMPRGK